MAGYLGSTRIWTGNFRLEGISSGDAEHSSYASEPSVATDDRNRIAVQLAGLAFGRATTHLSSIILSLRAWQLNGEDVQTQELAKGIGQRYTHFSAFRASAEAARLYKGSQRRGGRRPSSES